MPENEVSKISEWRKYWPLPIAAALGYSISVLHLYAIGPFIEPVQQAFGWSRTQVSFGATIVGLVGALGSVGVGMLVDRTGPRIVGLTGAVVMGVAFGLLGTATGTATNWILLWALVALGNLGLQATVLTSAVASRFRASRGLAFGLTFSGGSLGAAVFPILAAWLVGAYGWRSAFIAIGAIWGAVAIPFMFFFFRGAQDVGRKEHAAKPPSLTLDGVEVAQAFRSAIFYKLMMASGLLTFTNMGIIVHFVPILTDRGADPLGAAGIASLVGIFSMMGRLGTGLLLDRFPGRTVGSLMFCLPIIACGLLLFAGSHPLSQAAAAACIGVTVGAEIDVIAYLASRHFGLKHFGILFGVIISALTIGVALGPLAAGMAYDLFGSYRQFLLLTMAAMAASSLALASLPPPPEAGPGGMASKG